jgi:hypothetical protein
MKTQLTSKGETRLARPLNVLSPLIRKDLETGERLSMSYYISAGVKLNEGRENFPKGPAGSEKFWKWFEKQDYPVARKQAGRYMKLATADISKSRTRESKAFPSIRQAIGEGRRTTLSAADRAAILEEQARRHAATDARGAMGHKILKAGYRALAKKLHPDKGGSNDEMALLNEAKDELEDFFPYADSPLNEEELQPPDEEELQPSDEEELQPSDEECEDESCVLTDAGRLLHIKLFFEALDIVYKYEPSLFKGFVVEIKKSIEWLSGLRPLPEEIKAANTVNEIGDLLAQLHKTTKSFTPEDVYAIRSNQEEGMDEVNIANLISMSNWLAALAKLLKPLIVTCKSATRRRAEQGTKTTPSSP